jgi:hypothetical protein
MERNPGESRRRLMSGLGIKRRLANTLLSAGYTDPSSLKALNPSDLDKIKGLSIKEKGMLMKRIKEI